jgi:hypothetical protein
MDPWLMKGFDDVAFTWRDQTYIVPANRQMMLIAKVEDALSAGSGKQAIGILLQPEGPPYSRLAAAFGAALRHAGALVTDEEIYLEVMGDFAEGNADASAKVQAAVLSILSVIAPPMARKLKGKPEATADDTEKKA